ncbi:MAG: hypothetical protein EOO71_17710 [Myxococcaceae bacterium]|nr:MAG: hypothetical protein EOO71_17710 [Myxococcaceae bacterium]
MPNLDTLLKDTLLLTAALGAPYQSFGGKGAHAQGAGGTTRGANWAWSHDVASPHRVTQLTYDLAETPFYSAQTCTVLEELIWHPIEVTCRGRALTLELTQEFLLRKYEASSGAITNWAKNRHWIPAVLDRGMMLVFGFQVNLRAPSGTVTLEPIPADVLEKDDFMPARNGRPPKPVERKVKRTETGTLQLAPLRVLVCAEFVCCKESTDYVPNSLARVSRFRPHLMLMSNRDLERMEAKVSLRRPAQSTMQHAGSLPPPPQDPHGGHPHGGHSHGQQEQLHAQGLLDPNDRDEMVHDMATGLWADSNTSSFSWDKILNGVFPPFWSSIFSRVKTDVAPGASYLMVSPTLAGGTGHVAYTWNPETARYLPVPQKVMARQGEFDNIHIAPPMLPPRSIREACKDQPMLKLDAITMAPFCIHDCLHMHWRWCPTGEEWLHGWDENGPYNTSGAPQIPANQSLFVTVESRHGFSYRVHADTGLEAGRWQYVLHEGLSYGTNTAAEWIGHVQVAMMGYFSPWPLVATRSWAMFYWALRYWRMGDVAADRLLEDGAPVP